MTKQSLVIAILASIVFGMAIAALDYLRPLRFSTQIYPPYQIVIDNHVGGSMADIVICAANKAGHPFSIDYGSWPEMQARVKDGDRDAFFGAFRTAWRDSFAVASEPVIRARIVKVFSNHMPMDPPRVGVKIGAGVAAQESTSDLIAQRVELNDNADIIDAMLVGDVDYTVLDVEILNNVLARKSLQLDTFRTSYLYDQAYVVYFSKRFLVSHVDYLGKFNEALKGCRNEWSRIY